MFYADNNDENVVELDEMYTKDNPEENFIKKNLSVGDITTGKHDSLIITYTLFNLIITFVLLTLFFSILYLFDNQIKDINNLLIILSFGHVLFDAIILVQAQGVTTLNKTNTIITLSMISLFLDIINIILRFLIFLGCLLKKDSIHIFSLNLCGSLLKQFILFIPVIFSLFFTIIIFYQAYSKRQYLKRIYLDEKMKIKVD